MDSQVCTSPASLSYFISNSIALIKDPRIEANVQINGTGFIGKGVSVGANAEINGTFDLQNSKILPNSDLKCQLVLRGVTVDGKMQNCSIDGTVQSKSVK